MKKCYNKNNKGDNMDLKKEQGLEKINKLFSNKLNNIEIYVFLDEKNFNSLTEEEYKKNLKEEIISLRNNGGDEHFKKEVKEAELKIKHSLELIQLTSISRQISEKEFIYKRVPENLIDEFVDECYKRNKKYIKEKFIEGYRSAWQEKNAFWKLINQKYNPKKIDFDSMENEDIDTLSDTIKRR